jgi:hypothetical protein
MAWQKTAADRQRDAQVYGSAEYRRNREAARRRANGTCEQCQHRHPRLQCDHVVPTTQNGTHHLDNLRMLCAGAGSCRCHERKTATEGGGFRQRGRVSAEDPPVQARTAW